MKNNILSFLKLSGGVFAFLGIMVSEIQAQDNSDNKQPKTVREIFVPESEFGAILSGCTDRVLLPRNEFELLEKEAERIAEEKKKNAEKTKSARPEGIDFVLLSSQSKIQILGEQALITTDLEYELFTDELIAIPISLENVVLQSAMRNQGPALIGKKEESYLFFTAKKGKHRLQLKCVTSLKVDSTRQEISAKIPQGAISQLFLEAPGDVDLLSGATVVKRTVDGPQENQPENRALRATRLELLQSSENVHLVLSLNSHKMREVRTVLARSVQFDEITPFYNRIHATVSLNVLFQPIENFRFSVPENFEITDVRCTQLNRWKMNDGKLEIDFHEPTSGQITIYISASRDSKDGDVEKELSDWRAAYLEPLDVDANSAVVGLLVDTELELSEIRTGQLLPIDATVLRSAIPPSVFEVAPGSPAIRIVAAWYAPQGECSIAAKFFHPPGEIDVLTNLVLELQEREPVLHGAFILTPFSEKIFSATLTVPKNWQLVKMSDSADQPLDFDRLDEERDEKTAETTDYKIRFPRGINPGDTFRILFELRGETVDWFGTWTQKELSFPRIALKGASKDRGTIAVNAEEDWTVIPKNVQRLILLDDAEKAKSLTGISSQLAFRYLNPPYDLDLLVEKKEPRIKATTYSFYRIQPSLLTTHYELSYFVEEAKTKTLSFLLPEKTSTTPAIKVRPMFAMMNNIGNMPNSVAYRNEMSIKETSSEKVEIDGKKYRRWTVQLAQPMKGNLWLIVDLEEPIAEEKLTQQQELELPSIRADHVVWQSGLFAIEGHEELNTDIFADQNLRSVDVGELVPAAYRIGARLLGAFQEPEKATVRVGIQRNSAYSLTPSIIQSVSSEIRIGTDNKTLNFVQYDLKTKATYLKIALSAQEELWSVFLDEELVKPQRVGEHVLIDIPSRNDSEVRKLKILFSAQGTELNCPTDSSRSSNVRIPQLFVPFAEETEKAQEEQTTQWNAVPIVKYRYTIAPPPNFKIVELGGRSIGRISIEGRAPRPAILDVGTVFFGKLNPLNYIGCGVKHDPSDPNIYTLEKLPEEAQDALADTVPYTIFRSDANESAKVPASRRGKAERPGKPAADRAEVRSEVSPTPKQQIALSKRLESAQPVSIQLQENIRTNPETIVHSGIGRAQSDSLSIQMLNQKTLKIGEGIVWAICLLLGFLYLGCSVSKKTVLILALMILGTVLVFVPGLEQYEHLVNAIVYAAVFGLIPLFLLTGIVRCLVKIYLWLCKSFWTVYNTFVQGPTISALILLALFGLLGTGLLTAQEPEDKESKIPLVLPKDAIIVPYDLSRITKNEIPDPAKLKNQKQSILVPGDMYQQLRKTIEDYEKEQKNADATNTDKTPIVPLSFAGAKFCAKLDSFRSASSEEGTEDSSDLMIEGTIRFELFTDAPTVIPLPISQSAIDSATLDGKPAQLGFADMNTKTPTQQVPQVQQTLLFVQGKGAHELAIRIRFTVQRQGGWKIVQGVLPNIPGTSVELSFERPGTEVRLGNPLDLRKFESKTENETLQTTLAPTGAFLWQWREKISEGEVDHSLTANSEAVFDIQEDGFQLIWNISLSLQKGRYESFRFRIPHGYTICSVDGPNVRGWMPVESADSTDTATDVLIDVELLKQADAQENIVFVLRKNEAFEEEKTIQANVPKLHVLEAAMHHGRITMRRSPFLDVKTSEIVAATRTDLPAEGSKNSAPSTGSNTIVENPFGIRPLSAFRFTSEAFQIGFSAVPIQGTYRARISNILKLSEFNYRLESRIELRAEKRALHRAKIQLPKNLSLEKVSMDIPFEWSKSVEENEQFLSLFLTEGLLGSTTLSLEGDLLNVETSNGSEKLAPLTQFVIPRLRVLDMKHDATEFGVLLDPAFDVSAKDWENLTTISRQTNFRGMIQPEQISLLRLQIQQSNVSEQYEGKLVLVPRSAEVFCDTITNVSVQSQSLEETIMLDYIILGAGIRRVELILPHWMRDARIDVPMLQLKRIVPLNDQADSPLHVKIDLQDDVMNELRILIRNDRLLIPETDYRVCVPILLTGQANRRFVVFENRMGLDELNVDAAKLGDFRPLQREGMEWNYIASILGSGAIQAYWLPEEEGKAENYEQKLTKQSLSFKMKKRETVALSKASIGLAETRMVFGSSGEYITEQVYRIDNKTEQFLDVLLPKDAQIWVVRNLSTQEWESQSQKTQETQNADLGEPMKPCTLSSGEIALYRNMYRDDSKIKGIADALDNEFVRIPLVKTEVGDLDRVVRIVYAGKTEPLTSWTRLHFPLMKVLNIPVESSTVRLGLPTDFRFYRFEGTLQLANLDAVRSQEEAYREKAIGKLQSVSVSKNIFENARAYSSLDFLTSKESGYDSSGSGGAYGVFGASGSPRGRETRQEMMEQLSPPQSQISSLTQEGRDIAGRPGIVAQQGQSFFPQETERSNSSKLIQQFSIQQNQKARNIVAQTQSNLAESNKRSLKRNDMLMFDSDSKKSSEFQSDWLAQNDLSNPQLDRQSLRLLEEEKNDAQTDIFAQNRPALPSAAPRELFRNESLTEQRRGFENRSQETQMDKEFAKKIIAQQNAAISGQLENLPRKIAAAPVPQRGSGSSRRSSSGVQEMGRLNTQLSVAEEPLESLSEEDPFGDSDADESDAHIAATPTAPSVVSGTSAAPVPPGAFGGGMMSGGGMGMGAGMGGMGMGGRGGMGGMSGASGQSMPQRGIPQQNVVPQQPFQRPAFGEMAIPVPEVAAFARNLASLDVELPSLTEESIEYYFTTPQGEVNLSVYCVSSDLVDRGKEFGSSVVILSILCGCVAIGISRSRKNRKNYAS